MRAFWAWIAALAIFGTSPVFAQDDVDDASAELSLASTGVTAATKSVVGSRSAIERAIEDAKDLLDDGRVQDARRILNGLASEMVITVTNIPLGTYPDAIKAIAPMIDDGEIEAARHGLQAALNTLVLADHIVPLPVLRS